MKHNVMLSVTSLLSVILFLVHVTGDIIRGIEPGTTANLGTVPILVVWLYGTLVIPDRLLGKVITVLGALLAMVVPVLHLRGRGVGGAIAQSDGAFLFIWTVFALGVTGLFTLFLLVHDAVSRQRA